MRTRRLAMVFASLLALTACSASGSGPPPRQEVVVTGPEARRLVEGGATLLDVRTGDEFGDEHLPGAVNIPVDDLASRLGEVPKERPVVVYCRSGSRSARAAQVLAAKGYEVRDLGRMSAW